MADKIPRYFPGEALTGYPTADVAAGTLAMISADKTASGDYSIKPCTADSKSIGMIARDVTVANFGAHDVDRRTAIYPEGVLRLLTAAGITAGEEFYCSGAGKITKISGEHKALGMVLATAAEGTYAECILYL